MPRLKTLAPQYAYKDLSKAIKHGMLDKDMKQYDLAAKVKISKSSIGRWIANPEKLTIEQMRSLVEALGIEMLPVIKALGYRERDMKRMEEE